MQHFLRTYRTQIEQFPWASRLQLPQEDALVLKDRLCSLTTLGDIRLEFLQAATAGHGLYSLDSNGVPFIKLWVAPNNTIPLLTFAHEFAHYVHDMEWRRKTLLCQATKVERAHGPRFRAITSNVLIMCRTILDVRLPIE